MAQKKRKAGQPWWRGRRTQRRLAVVASLAVAIGTVAWLVVRGGGGSSAPQEYLVEPAPPFSLPTIAGEEFSLTDHLDKNVVLLYFNEGLG